MITKGLLDRIYEAASIQRWNDHVRPVEFTELDKQAHKMILAYVLGKLEESEGQAQIDWIKLIEGGIFEFFPRVILTDIKAPVFHKLMSKKGLEINTLVLQKIDEDIKGLGGDFGENFRRYLFDGNYARFEKRILKAAHYLATNWEFQIIYNTAPFVYGIDKTKRGNRKPDRRPLRPYRRAETLAAKEILRLYRPLRAASVPAEMGTFAARAKNVGPWTHVDSGHDVLFLFGGNGRLP